MNPSDIVEPVIYQSFHQLPSIHPIRSVSTRLDPRSSHTHQPGARSSSTTPDESQDQDLELREVTLINLNRSRDEGGTELASCR